MINLVEKVILSVNRKIKNSDQYFVVNVILTNHGRDRKSRQGFSFIKNTPVKEIMRKNATEILKYALKNKIRQKQFGERTKGKRLVIRDLRSGINFVVALEFVRESQDFLNLNIVIISMIKGENFNNIHNTPELVVSL